MGQGFCYGHPGGIRLIVILAQLLLCLSNCGAIEDREEGVLTLAPTRLGTLAAYNPTDSASQDKIGSCLDPSFVTY